MTEIKKPKMNREEKSWVLYDVANSAFILIIVTTIMPIFFKEFAAFNLPNAVSTARWGIANSIASLIIALSAPVLGTFADYRGGKKRFFIFFLIIGLLATSLFIVITKGAWLQCLILFIIARIGYMGSLIFYDSFLVDVTEKKRMDWVSTNGYAWGYIGSTIPFIVVIVLVILFKSSISISETAAKSGFVIVILWWLLFSLPLIRNVKQKHYLDPEPQAIRKSFSRLFNTLKLIKHHRQAFLFLCAYFFYIDGVDTVIIMAIAYGKDIGLGATVLISVVLMIQVVAFPFALLYGRLSQKLPTKKLLFVGILVYCVITIVSFFLPFLDSMNLKIGIFWFLAFLIATSMGGIQALSRSFFGKLIPEKNSAEFFGFYNIFGKFATILGPLLMGVISQATGSSQYGLLSILILFIIGGILLAKVEG